MIRKSFAFILFVLIGAGVAASQTPERKGEKEGAATRAFALSFDSDGGYLGVQTEEVTRDNIGKYTLRDVKGVGVDSVVEGSPAQIAGLQKGDVILKVNGDEITSTRKLSRLVAEISPDHQARLTVIRGGSEREVTVTVGKRPMPKFGEGSFEWSGPLSNLEIPQLENLPNLRSLPRIGAMPVPPNAPNAPMTWSFGSRRQIGVGMTMLTKQLADHYGVESGALVTGVRDNSPAAKAGIKAGDIIIEAEGQKVDGNFDLARAIGEKKEGSISLTIVRDRNRQTVTVTPEEVKGGFEHNFQFATPDVPDAPGVFKLTRPAAPMTPLPLNHLLVPGRVI